ncbi:MAG: ABC transporter substrate-binding protein, partial [Simkaniaceae bacterium]|nr:ABC transporter substrate-binding protein [Simkaniaceae bacterium]
MKRLCLTLALLALLMTSCDSEKGSKASNKSTLHVNFLTAPPTLDPRKTRDMTSSTAIFMLFEGLTKSTPESSHAPSLAERIEISDDQRIYTFYLREAKWSNGDLITSYDFEYTWKSMLSPTFPSPNANLLYSIKNAKEAKLGEVDIDRVGILCPDSQTLVVELNNPVP